MKMTDQIKSLHIRLGRLIYTAQKARNIETHPLANSVLHGKIKAYAEIRNYLESKYFKTIPELFEMRKMAEAFYKNQK